jgi:hypothetical protein
VQNDYINRQHGYLSLPVGMLLARKVPKPRMVVVAIGKVDLFSEHDLMRVEGGKARTRLDELFRPHLALVKDACSRAGVPFKVEYCSALEGWRTESIMRHIQDRLFAS